MVIHKMDIRTLRYFAEVVRQNGFRRAGEALHVTQPAISRAISQLEEELQVDLLVRENRGVRMTAEGEVVHRHASLILRQVSNLQHELADMRSLLTGTLRVGLPPTTGSSFFANVITEFRRQHPKIDLQIAEYGSYHLETALMEGQVEIAAALLPVDAEHYHVQTFVRDRLSLLVAADHPFAALKAIPLSDIAGQSFVSLTEDFKINSLIDGVCRAQGFTPAVIGRSSHLDLIVSMVTSGMGVSLLPETACREMTSPRLVVVPVVDPQISYELALVRPRGSYLTASCKAWIEVAASVLKFELLPSFMS